MLADVIFPAFTAPYVAMMFFPYLAVAVVASEVGVYRIYNRSVGYWRLTNVALLANIVSSLVGFVIAAFLPSGLVRRPVEEHSIIEPGPYRSIFAAGGFMIALGLSIWIEYAVIRWRFPQVLCQKTLLRCVIVANITSYAVLLALTVLSAWLLA